MVKKDANTSKLIVTLVSGDTTSAKTTRANSKNPVQKRHLSLYGPPYASKMASCMLTNLTATHIC